MKNIIICGTGEFAREVFYWIQGSEKNQNIKFKGFLDKSPNSLIPIGLNEYYLGDEDKYNFLTNDYILIAIADSNIREIVYKKLKILNINFFNYSHDSVIIGGKVNFGEGNIICPNSVLTTEISIGNCNIFNINTTVGHDVNIGSFNIFNSHCDITGYSNIKNNNFFGSRVSLLPKCKIGSNNKIAAGSVVYKGIRDNFIYLGNPAKKVGINE